MERAEATAVATGERLTNDGTRLSRDHDWKRLTRHGLLHSFKKAQSQLCQQGHFCFSRGTLPLQLRRATYLFVILLRTMSEKLNRQIKTSLMSASKKTLPLQYWQKVIVI
jgi:hypothetical protein